ncbi:MAG: hypothetical protein H0U71_08980 [Gammaproteobacteria bacterium]|nr:hypothetical protein [Gammaproteobacteria bacterium]
MRIVNISIISIAILGLSACSTIGDRDGFLKDESKSYTKEKPVDRTVVIPQNLSSNNVQDYYEVPQAAPDAANIQPPLIPPGSAVPQPKSQPLIMSQQDRIRNAESAKIQGHTNPTANGSKPVGVNFSQAWVKVGHVLQAAKYKIVERDNTLGTYYVVDTTGTGGKVKKDMPIYQVHLKPSGQGTVVSVSPSNPGLQNQLNSSLND